jgi:uncharacterized metal-binding protein YceD (DUF177 family)
MIDDGFKIYVEQLRDGQIQEINESFSPGFLDVHEKDLSFSDLVEVQGQTYVTDDTLVLHLDIHTFGIIPCSICNEPVKVEMKIKGFYHAVPLEEIRGGIYIFRDILRETILLETPLLAECNQGKCPQREHIKKYLKKEPMSGKEDSEGYHPFAGIDFDEK